MYKSLFHKYKMEVNLAKNHSLAFYLYVTVHEWWMLWESGNKI